MAERADLSEVHEVLEAGVEMRFLPQPTDAPEMCVVNVCVHPEKAFEHRPHHIHEVARERYPILLRKDTRVIHLHMHSPAACVAWNNSALTQCNK